MFERVVGPILTRLLGQYVKEECFAPEKVQVGVWSGYVALSDLELKPSALEGLGLPVALVRGYIGRLELTLPWGSPGSMPLVVKVDRVYCVVQTVYDRPLEAVLSERRQRGKRVREAAEELLAAKNKPDGPALPGLLEKLVTKIVDNVQLHVRGLHLRWEDRVTVPARPWAGGITVESIHLQSTNAEWQPAAGQTASTAAMAAGRREPGQQAKLAAVYKQLTVHHLAVYWNPHLLLCDRAGPVPVPVSGIATLPVQRGSSEEVLEATGPAFPTSAFTTSAGTAAAGVRSVTWPELVRAFVTQSTGAFASSPSGSDSPTSMAAARSCSPSSNHAVPASPLRLSMRAPDIARVSHEELYGMIDLASCHLDVFATLCQAAVLTRSQREHSSPSSPQLTSSGDSPGRAGWLASPRQNLLLAPLDATVRLCISRDVRDLSAPQYAVQAQLNQLAVRIGRDQLTGMAQAFASVSNATMGLKQLHMRPTLRTQQRALPASPADTRSLPPSVSRPCSARAWFRYLAWSALLTRQASSFTLSWQAIRRRRMLRCAFCYLAARQLATGGPSGGGSGAHPAAPRTKSELLRAETALESRMVPLDACFNMVKEQRVWWRSTLASRGAPAAADQRMPAGWLPSPSLAFLPGGTANPVNLQVEVRNPFHDHVPAFESSAQQWLAIANDLAIGEPLHAISTPGDAEFGADAHAVALCIAGVALGMPDVYQQLAEPADDEDGPSTSAKSTMYLPYLGWAQAYKAAVQRGDDAAARKLLQASPPVPDVPYLHVPLMPVENAALARLQECLTVQETATLLARARALIKAAPHARRRAELATLSEAHAARGPSPDADQAPALSVPAKPPSSARAELQFGGRSMGPSAGGPGLGRAAGPGSVSGASARSGSARGGRVDGLRIQPWQSRAARTVGARSVRSKRSVGSGKSGIRSVISMPFLSWLAGADQRSSDKASEYDSEEDDAAMREAMLSEAQRRELYAIIDFDPASRPPIWPAGYAHSTVQLRVDAVNLQLCQAVHASEHAAGLAPSPRRARAQGLAALCMSGFDMQFTAYPSAWRCSAQVKTLRAMDEGALAAAGITLTPGLRTLLEPAHARTDFTGPFMTATLYSFDQGEAVPEARSSRLQRGGGSSSAALHSAAGSSRRARLAGLASSSRASALHDMTPVGSHAMLAPEQPWPAEQQPEERGALDDLSSLGSDEGLSDDGGAAELGHTGWVVEQATSPSVRAPAVFEPGWWRREFAHLEHVPRPDWGTGAQTCVQLDARAMKVVYAPELISALAEFMDVPVIGWSDDAQRRAAAAIANARARMSATLDTAQARNAVAVNISVQQPHFLLPGAMHLPDAKLLSVRADAVHLTHEDVKSQEDLRALLSVQLRTPVPAQDSSVPADAHSGAEPCRMPAGVTADVYDALRVSVHNLAVELHTLQRLDEAPAAVLVRVPQCTAMLWVSVAPTADADIPAARLAISAPSIDAQLSKFSAVCVASIAGSMDARAQAHARFLEQRARRATKDLIMALSAGAGGGGVHIGSAVSDSEDELGTSDGMPSPQRTPATHATQPKPHGQHTPRSPLRLAQSPARTDTMLTPVLRPARVATSASKSRATQRTLPADLGAEAAGGSRSVLSRRSWRDDATVSTRASHLGSLLSAMFAGSQTGRTGADEAASRAKFPLPHRTSGSQLAASGFQRMLDGGSVVLRHVRRVSSAMTVHSESTHSHQPDHPDLTPVRELSTSEPLTQPGQSAAALAADDTLPYMAHVAVQCGSIKLGVSTSSKPGWRPGTELEIASVQCAARLAGSHSSLRCAAQLLLWRDQGAVAGSKQHVLLRVPALSQPAAPPMPALSFTDFDLPPDTCALDVRCQLRAPDSQAGADAEAGPQRQPIAGAPLACQVYMDSMQSCIDEAVIAGSLQVLQQLQQPMPRAVPHTLLGVAAVQYLRARAGDMQVQVELGSGDVSLHRRGLWIAQLAWAGVRVQAHTRAVLAVLARQHDTGHEAAAEALQLAGSTPAAARTLLDSMEYGRHAHCAAQDVRVELRGVSLRSWSHASATATSPPPAGFVLAAQRGDNALAVSVRTRVLCTTGAADAAVFQQLGQVGLESAQAPEHSESLPLTLTTLSIEGAHIMARADMSFWMGLPGFFASSPLMKLLASSPGGSAGAALDTAPQLVSAQLADLELLLPAGTAEVLPDARVIHVTARTLALDTRIAPCKVGQVPWVAENSAITLLGVNLAAAEQPHFIRDMDVAVATSAVSVAFQGCTPKQRPDSPAAAAAAAAAPRLPSPHTMVTSALLAELPRRGRRRPADTIAHVQCSRLAGSLSAAELEALLHAWFGNAAAWLAGGASPLGPGEGVTCFTCPSISLRLSSGGSEEHSANLRAHMLRVCAAASGAGIHSVTTIAALQCSDASQGCVSLESSLAPAGVHQAEHAALHELAAHDAMPRRAAVRVSSRIDASGEGHVHTTVHALRGEVDSQGVALLQALGLALANAATSQSPSLPASLNIPEAAPAAQFSEVQLPHVRVRCLIPESALHEAVWLDARSLQVQAAAGSQADFISINIEGCSARSEWRQLSRARHQPTFQHALVQDASLGVAMSVASDGIQEQVVHVRQGVVRMSSAGVADLLPAIQVYLQALMPPTALAPVDPVRTALQLHLSGFEVQVGQQVQLSTGAAPAWQPIARARTQYCDLKLALRGPHVDVPRASASIDLDLRAHDGWHRACSVANMAVSGAVAPIPTLQVHLPTIRAVLDLRLGAAVLDSWRMQAARQRGALIADSAEVDGDAAPRVPVCDLLPAAWHSISAVNCSGGELLLQFSSEDHPGPWVVWDGSCSLLDLAERAGVQRRCTLLRVGLHSSSAQEGDPGLVSVPFAKAALLSQTALICLDQLQPEHQACVLLHAVPSADQRVIWQFSSPLQLHNTASRAVLLQMVPSAQLDADGHSRGAAVHAHAVWQAVVPPHAACSVPPALCASHVLPAITLLASTVHAQSVRLLSPAQEQALARRRGLDPDLLDESAPGQHVTIDTLDVDHVASFGSVQHGLAAEAAAVQHSASGSAEPVPAAGDLGSPDPDTPVATPGMRTARSAPGQRVARMEQQVSISEPCALPGVVLLPAVHGRAGVPISSTSSVFGLSWDAQPAAAGGAAQGALEHVSSRHRKPGSSSEVLLPSSSAKAAPTACSAQHTAAGALPGAGWHAVLCQQFDQRWCKAARCKPAYMLPEQAPAPWQAPGQGSSSLWDAVMPTVHTLSPQPAFQGDAAALSRAVPAPLADQIWQAARPGTTPQPTPAPAAVPARIHVRIQPGFQSSSLVLPRQLHFGAPIVLESSLPLAITASFKPVQPSGSAVVVDEVADAQSSSVCHAVPWHVGALVSMRSAMGECPCGFLLGPRPVTEWLRSRTTLDVHSSTPVMVTPGTGPMLQAGVTLRGLMPWAYAGYQHALQLRVARRDDGALCLSVDPVGLLCCSSVVVAAPEQHPMSSSSTRVFKARQLARDGSALGAASSAQQPLLWSPVRTTRRVWPRTRAPRILLLGAASAWNEPANFGSTLARWLRTSGGFAQSALQLSLPWWAEWARPSRSDWHNLYLPDLGPAAGADWHCDAGACRLSLTAVLPQRFQALHATVWSVEVGVAAPQFRLLPAGEDRALPVVARMQARATSATVPGAHWVCHVGPALHMHSRLPFRVRLRQEGSAFSFDVPAGSRMPVYCSASAGALPISFRVRPGAMRVPYCSPDGSDSAGSDDDQDPFDESVPRATRHWTQSTPWHWSSAWQADRAALHAGTAADQAVLFCQHGGAGASATGMGASASQAARAARDASRISSAWTEQLGVLAAGTMVLGVDTSHALEEAGQPAVAGNLVSLHLLHWPYMAPSKYLRATVAHQAWRWRVVRVHNSSAFPIAITQTGVQPSRAVYVTAPHSWIDVPQAEALPIARGVQWREPRNFWMPAALQPAQRAWQLSLWALPADSAPSPPAQPDQAGDAPSALARLQARALVTALCELADGQLTLGQIGAPVRLGVVEPWSERTAHLRALGESELAVTPVHDALAGAPLQVRIHALSAMPQAAPASAEVQLMPQVLWSPARQQVETLPAAQQALALHVGHVELKVRDGSAAQRIAARLALRDCVCKFSSAESHVHASLTIADVLAQVATGTGSLQPVLRAVSQDQTWAVRASVTVDAGPTGALLIQQPSVSLSEVQLTAPLPLLQGVAGMLQRQVEHLAASSQSAMAAAQRAAGDSSNSSWLDSSVLAITAAALASAPTQARAELLQLLWTLASRVPNHMEEQAAVPAPSTHALQYHQLMQLHAHIADVTVAAQLAAGTPWLSARLKHWSTTAPELIGCATELQDQVQSIMSAALLRPGNVAMALIRGALQQLSHATARPSLPGSLP